jgi:GNAT superfamily N-acetyltransferase
VVDIEVRRARASDIDGFAESSAALFAIDGATRDPLRNREWPRTHGTEWCADLVADPDALVLVAAADEEVVGHLVGTFTAASAMWVAPRAELVSMFVSSRWRAQGVGGRLVEDFQAWARSRGALRLQVTAYVANEGALRFYRRKGFASLSSELVLGL